MYRYSKFHNIAWSKVYVYHHWHMMTNDSYVEQKEMQRRTKYELHFPSALACSSSPAFYFIPDLVPEKSDRSLECLWSTLWKCGYFSKLWIWSVERFWLPLVKKCARLSNLPWKAPLVAEMRTWSLQATTKCADNTHKLFIHIAHIHWVHWLMWLCTD